MASVELVLTKIAAVQANIAGVVRAYDGSTPPESVEDEPCFVNLHGEYDEATIDYRPSSERHTYPVTMLLLLSRQDGPAAMTLALPFIERTRAAFRATATLGGLVSWAHIERYRVTSVVYAGVTYLAVRFVLRVQMTEPTSPAPG